MRFALTFDMTTRPGQALLATAEFLYAELARPGGLATMPAARRETEAALMTQLLMAIPSQLTAQLSERPTHTGRSRVREVMEFLDAHPERAASTPTSPPRSGSVSARRRSRSARSPASLR